MVASERRLRRLRRTLRAGGTAARGRASLATAAPVRAAACVFRPSPFLLLLFLRSAHRRSLTWRTVPDPFRAVVANAIVPRQLRCIFEPAEPVPYQRRKSCGTLTTMSSETTSPLAALGTLFAKLFSLTRLRGIVRRVDALISGPIVGFAPKEGTVCRHDSRGRSRSSPARRPASARPSLESCLRLEPTSCLRRAAGSAWTHSQPACPASRRHPRRRHSCARNASQTARSWRANTSGACRRVWSTTLASSLQAAWTRSTWTPSLR